MLELMAKKRIRKKARARKATPKKKAGTQRTKSKRAAPKKAAAKKAAPKKKAPRRKPIKRRDATGHLDPSYAHDLRRRSLENLEHDDDRAFLKGKTADDAIAQELGREFVET